MQDYIDFLGRHVYLTMALVVISVLWIMSEISRRNRPYGEVDPSGLTRLVNQHDALILDVREDSEVRQGKIMNSRHIPVGTLADKLDQLADYKDKPIVVYCRSGNRSASACNILVKNGFNQIHNLSGGIMAWQGANMPVVKK